MIGVGIAQRSLQDEDYKTAIAQGKPEIPKGTSVIVVDKITNFYGEYYKVKYNDSIYYVPLNGIKIVEE